MKVAFTGPQSVTASDIVPYLPEGTDEIIPAGMWSAGESMLQYANTNGIKVTEYLVEYEFFGTMALMEHFMRAIDRADQVIIFREGLPDAESYIDQCRKQRKPLRVVG